MSAVTTVPDAEAMRDLGRTVAASLRAGDVVVLSGPLGAGKTTFVQGLALGLRVRGAVTSPTFVIARVHPPLGAGPALVHVDAYRVPDLREFEDLGLDADLDRAVTVVEWGETAALTLSDRPVVITIERTSDGADSDGPRIVSVTRPT